MRYTIIPLLCVAALLRASAQDTPVKQPSAASPAGGTFKQVVYKNPESGSTVTLTGPGDLVLDEGGEKLSGKYTIQDKTMHVVEHSQTAGEGTLTDDFAITEDGLYSKSRGGTFLTPAALEKKGPGLDCLQAAKFLYLGCKLYANDHDGKFPANFSDLFPDYLDDKKKLASPLSAKKEAVGFDYFGAGGTDTDAASKILIRSKDTTADGGRIIIYFDGSAEIKAEK